MRDRYTNAKEKHAIKARNKEHKSVAYNSMTNEPHDEKLKERFHRKPYTKLHRNHIPEK